VQEFAVALASWPVEPLGGEFIVCGPAENVNALLASQLQACSWPKRVHKVDASDTEDVDEHALSQVFPAAKIVKPANN
jgi:hypothetical protein